MFARERRICDAHSACPVVHSVANGFRLVTPPSAHSHLCEADARHERWSYRPKDRTISSGQALNSLRNGKLWLPRLARTRLCPGFVPTHSAKCVSQWLKTSLLLSERRRHRIEVWPRPGAKATIRRPHYVRAVLYSPANLRESGSSCAQSYDPHLDFAFSGVPGARAPLAHAYRSTRRLRFGWSGPAEMVSLSATPRTGYSWASCGRRQCSLLSTSRRRRVVRKGAFLSRFPLASTMPEKRLPGLRPRDRSPAADVSLRRRRFVLRIRRPPAFKRRSRVMHPPGVRAAFAN